jgi:XisH protein
MGAPMPAQDVYHNQVRNALIKDGWTITHDPYTMTFGQRDVFVDLGAERILAAERGDERIAVEVKSFQGSSDIRDLEVAVGQYVFYRSLLVRFDPGRKLVLAVPVTAFANTLQEPIARPVLSDLSIALIAFDPQTEVITQWTK